MSVVTPTPAVLRAVAARFGVELTDADLPHYLALVEGALASHRRLDALAEPRPPVKYPRTPGHRPAAGDNPHNAWAWRCRIEGALDGLLAGRTVAVKDNTAVAGVPMMNGSAMLESFVPDVDATIVTRILEAGGTIVGKAVCEPLCMSGGSHLADTGPVTNPHDATRSAGGSSGGSAALVAGGAVDMATGGDQGGSIRMPASYSGCCGLKPTFGLVPYTGIMPIERTLDHAGPLAGNVTDLATLLQVMAGPDAWDPRQRGCPTVPDYLAALDRGAAGLRVGVVKEGFGWPASEGDVDGLVLDAASRLRQAGATVETVGIPWHRDAVHVWAGIAVEGSTVTMMKSFGGGTNAGGYIDTALVDALRRGIPANPEQFTPTLKLVTFLGEYLQTRYGGRYYAKARNLSFDLTAAYEAALQKFDVLVMPTTPMKATLLPSAGAPPTEIVDRAFELHVNTCAFDVTGHPAVSLPCGTSDGLPVGMMLIGRKFDEVTLLRAARAYETTFAAPRPARMRDAEVAGAMP